MKKVHNLLFLLVLYGICFYSPLYGQDKVAEDAPKSMTDPLVPKAGGKKPVHEKKTFQDKDNKIYWQVDLPVYLQISSSPNGEQHPLKTVKTKAMESHANPMYFDGHGVHYIKHQDYGHTIPEHEVAFEVYVDGIAPVTRITFEGAPVHVTGGTTYYGKGLRTRLEATDEMSGLDNTLHSLNGADYAPYKAEQAYTTEQTYTYGFYSVDRVGNVEKEKIKTFVLDLTPPVTENTITGTRLDQIFSPKVNVALKATDKLSGVKQISWQIDNGKFLPYTKNIWVGYLKDGEHSIQYKAIDQVKNEEVEKTIKFYLDKTAPVVTASIQGDQYAKGGKTYISERSKIALSATDNKAGVDKIYYSLDEGAQLTYNSPFQLNAKQGTHQLRFRGIDKVENLGAYQTDEAVGNLYLDLSAPQISHDFIGAQFSTRDTLFITSETQVRLKASDYQSGVQKIGYQLDGQESTFETPFTIEKDGYHEVDYYALDQVNNKKEGDFFLVVDNEGPEIFHHFSMNHIGVAKLDDINKEVPVYSPHNLLYLAATDAAVGTNQIYYSLDGGAEKLYTGPIKNLSKGFKTLEIRATDHLGNESKSEVIHFMIK
ncbi:MAG: hypothetical protein D6730_19460 [Bacteroidetes bacterium]|nr:MAG: hypothetical protein D6730_19460 [Bacteroidota bacterium]